MNRELRRFLKEFREPDGSIDDLYKLEDIDYVPQKSGAYIFLSREKKFVYPNGESQVIYIGMSNDLNRRITRHHKHSVHIRSLSNTEIMEDWYLNKYQYINAFEAKVFWFTTRGQQEEKNLESLLLEHFYDKYHAIPVGNGAFSFSK